MISVKQKIKDLFSRVGKSGGYHNRSFINPYRDWVNTLRVFFGALVLSMIVSFTLFFFLQSGDPTPISSLDVKTINREELRQTIDFYRARNNALEQLIEYPPTVIDPGL